MAASPPDFVHPGLTAAPRAATTSFKLSVFVSPQLSQQIEVKLHAVRHQPTLSAGLFNVAWGEASVHFLDPFEQSCHEQADIAQPGLPVNAGLFQVIYRSSSEAVRALANS